MEADFGFDFSLFAPGNNDEEGGGVKLPSNVHKEEGAEDLEYTEWQGDGGCGSEPTRHDATATKLFPCVIYKRTRPFHEQDQESHDTSAPHDGWTEPKIGATTPEKRAKMKRGKRGSKRTKRTQRERAGAVASTASTATTASHAHAFLKAQAGQQPAFNKPLSGGRKTAQRGIELFYDEVLNPAPVKLAPLPQSGRYAPPLWRAIFPLLWQVTLCFCFCRIDTASQTAVSGRRACTFGLCAVTHTRYACLARVATDSCQRRVFFPRGSHMAL